MCNNYEDKVDTLHAMLRQESKNYTKEEFHAFQMKAITEIQSVYPTQKLDPIDSSCRSKMCAWFQQICTFCQYDEEESLLIIENALDYLDRYVVTPKGSIALIDRNCYQGMAITCLYMATKIHATAAISAPDMSIITRNLYTTQQIEDMEYHILQSLQWHVNPPTISVFVSEFMKLLVAQLQQEHMHESMISLLRSVKDLVDTQIKAVVCDEKFVTIPASIIAFTTMLNAVQQLVVPTMHGCFQDAFQTIRSALLLSHTTQHGSSSCSIETNNKIMSVLHHFQQLSRPALSPLKTNGQQQAVTSSPTQTATAIISISV